MEDALCFAGLTFKSRLFIGTGKYASDALIPEVIAASGAEIITVALRRVGMQQEGVMDHIPQGMRLLPNTSGARTADEAVRLAHLARAAGCGDLIKIEVIADTRHLLPDGYETCKATEILAREGFIVLPYINPDLYVARACVEAGAAVVMPLAAPIGSNRGLKTKEMIGILLEELEVPVIVDAGLGAPSQACEAMEMGAAACLVNTGIASSDDPVRMAKAFKLAVEAGRACYLAGQGSVSERGVAQASSPLTGFLR
ncbi:MAG: thiazole synthase [Desulfovibrio sp.]|nr:thiazole synthase [Desulfovibrio sp.]